MRVSGVYCGALNPPLFAGSAAKLDFNVFPFVDLTGRHTVVNNGVTQSSGKAAFDSTRNTFLAITGLIKDYELQRDFDLTLTFNVTALGGGAYIAAIHENNFGFPQSNLVIFVTSSGVLQCTLGSSFLTVSSASGTIVAGQDYKIKIVRRGTSLKVFIGAVLIGSITESVPAIPRILTIGGLNNFAANGLYGTIDDVDFKLLRSLIFINFEAFPFVDVTGRHSVVNYGVTTDSGYGYFTNPTDTSLVRLEVTNNIDDFRLQTDFDISFTANVASYAGRNDQLLFSFEGAGNTSIIECYIKNNGQIYLNFPGATFITASGLIAAFSFYSIRIEKRGSSAEIWVNDIARALISPSVPALANIPRKLVLGASHRAGGFGLNGRIDNFKFDVC